VGNSITAGACSSSNANTYPSQLQTMLGTNYRVTNYGVSGTTMLKKGDNPYWNTQDYKNALSSNSSIIIIMLGTNDAKTFNWGPHGTDFPGDYKDMINSFKTSSNTKIFVMTPPPLYPPDPYQMNATIINQIFPQLIPQIAKDNSLSTPIDIFNALGGATLNQPGITCDGCHPTDKGYNLMATTVYKYLQAHP